MSDKRITELTNFSSLVTGDLILGVDISDATMSAQGTTKSLSFGLLENSLPFYPLGNPSGFLSGVIPATGVNYTSPSNNVYALDKYIFDSPMNIKAAYGAYGDGIHDDTVAIRNALANEQYVFFPSGFYNISGEVTGLIQGQILEGANIYTVIYQQKSGANGINFRPSGVNPNNYAGFGTADIQVRNLTIRSRVPAQGIGLSIGQSGTGGAAGNILQLEYLAVNDFKTGIHLYSMGNTLINSVTVQTAAGNPTGDYGIFLEGDGLNSNVWNGLSVERYNTGVAYGVGGGAGNLISPIDFGSCNVNFGLTDQNNLIVLGGNMDSTLQYHTTVSNQSSLLAIGQQGESSPPGCAYVVDTYSNFVNINTSIGWSISGGDNANAVFLTPGVGVNVSGALHPGESWHGLPFGSVYDNSVDTAGPSNRGALELVIARSGAFAGDSIAFMRRSPYLTSGTSGSFIYQTDNLSNAFQQEQANTWLAAQTMKGVVVSGSEAGNDFSWQGALVCQASRINAGENICDLTVRQRGYNDGQQTLLAQNREGTVAVYLMHFGHGAPDIVGGSIISGKNYVISQNGGGASFTSVGAADNNVGTTFTATGTSPTWGSSGILSRTDNGYITVPYNMNVNGMATLNSVTLGHSNITFNATTIVDFAGTAFQTETVTGDVTFQSTNLAVGRSVTLRLVGDTTGRTLTFPGGWTFVGNTAPTALSGNAIAVLTLTSFGTSDGNVIAAYASTP